LCSATSALIKYYRKTVCEYLLQRRSAGKLSIAFPTPLELDPRIISSSFNAIMSDTGAPESTPGSQERRLASSDVGLASKASPPPAAPNPVSILAPAESTLPMQDKGPITPKEGSLAALLEFLIKFLEAVLRSACYSTAPFGFLPARLCYLPKVLGYFVILAPGWLLTDMLSRATGLLASFPR
jgi:hypothetical protein